MARSPVKIRKPHKCVYCLKEFPKGVSMYRETDKYDAFRTTYVCETCMMKLIKMQPDIDDIFAQDL